MAAIGLRILRLLLALMLMGQLASMIECTIGRDPDDYNDLGDEDEDDDYMFEEDDGPISSMPLERPHAGEKLSPERYYSLIRPRLGHFERYPEMRKLYEDYFEKSIQTRDISMRRISRVDDWRALRPTADFCVSFLALFKSKRYMINKPIDIIPLDACLEWLFLDEVTVEKSHPDYERMERAVSERELDLKQTTSTFLLNKVEDLRSDENLENIYRDTLFGVPDVLETVNGKRVVKAVGVPRKMRLKLKKYVLRLLDIHAQDPSKGCHSLWLDAYTSFMEQVYLDCAGDADCVHFGDQRIDEDRYFRLVAESTRQSSLNCYKTMQSSILSLMHKSYDSKATSVVFKRLLGKSENRQYENQKWSREMVKILQLVSGQEQDKPISLSDVVKSLWEIKAGEPDRTRELLGSLGEFALANADMRATEDDPQGVKRYTRAIVRLCKPYIDEKLFLAKAGAIDLDEEEIKNKEPFLFYHLVYSLIRLTNHESIYQITKDQFEADVLSNKWEALYLTTFACQMLSTTQGELSQDTNENAYEVSFQYDSLQYFEDWPIELMNQRLVKQAGKQDKAPVVEFKRAEIEMRPKISNDESDAADGADSDDDDDDADQDDAPKASGKRHGGGTRRHSAGKSLSEASGSLGAKVKKTLGRFKWSSSSGGGARKSAPSKYPMSEADIRKFHKQFGRWPDLPDDIREIYPNLPADCVKPKPKAAQMKMAQPKVGLQLAPMLDEPQQQQQQQPPHQPRILPAAAVQPTRPSGGAQQQVGYWASNWDQKDDLPAWNVQPQREPPAFVRSRADLF